MVGRRFGFVAAVLGMVLSLVLGSGQALAATGTSPDAAPVSAPASQDACGTLTSGLGWTSGGSQLWGTGSVLQSCSGWTKLCTYLYQNSPVGPILMQSKCSPLYTGKSMGHSTPRVNCYPGVWFSWTWAFAGSTVKRTASSPPRSTSC